MDKTESFRPGQRVRVRSSADSEFAGYAGTVVYVGNKVCDVRIRYRPKGSKTASTYIGTFRNEDLESFTQRTDLAYFSDESRAYGWRSGWRWVLAVILMAAITALIWHQ